MNAIRAFVSKREPDEPRFSLDEVCPGRAELFGLEQIFEMAGSPLPTLNSRADLVNRRRWELCKPGCACHRRGWIALPLRTKHAGTRRRANACFHKAAQRFVFSTLHFATPTVPTC